MGREGVLDSVIQGEEHFWKIRREQTSEGEDEDEDIGEDEDEDEDQAYEPKTE
jgi:hypothetical protein